MQAFRARQNIMVIEDQPEIQETLQNILEVDFNITVVGNAQDALFFLSENPTNY